MTASERHHASEAIDPGERDFFRERLPGQAFHDVLAALRERAAVVPVRFANQSARMITRYEALSRAFTDAVRFPAEGSYQITTEPVVGRSFISMPDPEHKLYRRLATPAFASRAVERYAASGLATLARDVVDTFSDCTTVDLVEVFTQKLPTLAISRLLGLPREREEEFHRWSLGLLSYFKNREQSLRCREEFTRYLTPVVEERRRNPKDDVISELVQAEVDGHKLDDEDIFSHIRLLFPTGAETTYNGLGNLFYALLTHEEAWQRVVAEADARDAAVHEALRWENPVALLPRLSPSRPIEFEGVEIPEHTPLLFAIAAANRDPRAFADPDRFDLDRRPDVLMSFGPGHRMCPGMHLARKEMRVGLDVLAERFPSMRLVDPREARPVGCSLRGPETLRVELR